ncbi:ATP synthase F0 subunit B [Desulfovibrio sulfodismutans]|uniref:ATP synthase subunit b n=1 Tax=Desulfolutivibrio sulfodismutans TaxID=63561 RepID=A0A7K3NS25_9BACT|nr:ATP synthase F0 subunit B [Desulfolutivibrio sulfodismutans]NDY58009.1 ATP synthase F0 subunit B [Desulfolutivibrio sulfodismutans]QLA13600.1 F0F1 ATP synthase subunit B [Desulfolutivibrio sulfodismutans DSM 3696]
MKGFIKVTAVGALLVLAMAAVAWASAEGGEAHGLNWKDFGFRVINFVLVVGVIWKLAGKKMGDFFRGRRVQIENQLSDLETRKVEAEKRLKTIEASIANLEAEKRQIVDEYRKQGEALRDSIVAAAEEKAVAIKAQAAVTAEQETKLAVERLRAEMADMVVDAARGMLAGKLSEKDQDKLVDEYLTKVVFN